MINPKLGNAAQLISAYELQFETGSAKGKSVILVHNGKLEVMFSKSNALDILYAKFNGKNVSFLSKNGINDNEGQFDNRFEAGFLYTCGMDNIGSCVSGKPKHGSLHRTAAENVNISVADGKVIVSGIVKDTALFGKNLILSRRFVITENSVEINDAIENIAYVDDNYVMLYHINFGYPFLDEDLKIEMDSLIKSEGVTPYARENIGEQFKITPPIDGGEEQCFYNYLKEGKIRLINKPFGVKCTVDYDVNQLPLSVEWKSMVSGDYALGIEPTTTRFDKFQLLPVKKGETKRFNVKIGFSEI